MNSTIDSAQVVTPSDSCLRNFSVRHIDETFETITGTHENALFYNCTFHNVRNARFINCDLSHSRFVSENPRDFMGLVASLDCFSFGNVELSEPALYCLLAMILKTKGNTAIRKAVLGALDHKKMFSLLKTFETLER